MTLAPEPLEARPPELTHAALFLRFLKFGALAFGGPVAQIAMIRRELVEEERWISSDHFNRLLAVMQILPGPEAHELCVHLGVRAKGRVGGLLAGLGFMLPGLALMLLLAWIYTRLSLQGTVLGAAFLGMQAAVIALITRAVHQIGKHILGSPWLWLVAGTAAVASLLGVSFWLVLPAAGATYVLVVARRYAAAAAVAAIVAGVALYLGVAVPEAANATVAARGAEAPSAGALFWSGLKAGLLTFGGAYTAIPFIRSDTVERGWMSDTQFLDGLGLSSVLPAPLVIFATFVGWASAGPAGALAVTAGIFLPAFAFSMIFYERLETLVAHRALQQFLAGVAAGVVGLIAVTLLDLARASLERTQDVAASVAIFAASLVLLYLWKSRLAAPVTLFAAALCGVFLLR